MFNLVNLDAKSVLPIALIVAAVGLAYWAFTRGNANAGANASGSTDASGTASYLAQLSSLATIESLLGTGTSTGAATTSTATTGNVQTASNTNAVATDELAQTSAPISQSGGGVVTGSSTQVGQASSSIQGVS